MIENIDLEIEKINKRLYRNRIDQYKERYKSWNWISTWELRGIISAREKIRELLVNGKRVTAGYYCTSVKGYHDCFIIWKD